MKHIKGGRGDGGERREFHELEDVQFVVVVFTTTTCLSPDDGVQIMMIITVGIHFPP